MRQAAYYEVVAQAAHDENEVRAKDEALAQLRHLEDEVHAAAQRGEFGLTMEARKTLNGHAQRTLRELGYTLEEVTSTGQRDEVVHVGWKVSWRSGNG